ncbi:MAG: hypothetical protein QE271_08895 [Bacteriovoracaceae bacterium]|nr:hypothetical protein [Bacteriovoracaceae bacterium]
MNSLNKFTGILFLIQLFMMEANSQTAPTFHCKTANQEYQFVVGQNFVKLFPQNGSGDESAKIKNRKIASLKNNLKTVHENVNNNWSKLFYHKGLQAKIHIANIKSPSDINDYFSLVSPEGHKMTYGLECLALSEK